MIYQNERTQLEILIFILICYGVYTYAASNVEIFMMKRLDGVHWVSKLQFVVTASIMLFIVARFSSVGESIEKQLQEKLKKLKKQNAILQADQLQMEQQNEDMAKVNRELEKYAYVASHDLKSPIRTVNSFLKLIKRNLKDYDDQDVHEYLNYATNGADQMYQLVEDILIFSRIVPEKNKYEKVDLNEIIVEVIDELQKNNKRLAQFIFNDLPVIYAHPHQMKLLFLELIENAILYNTNHQPTVKMTCISQDNSWFIAVEDNGIGISDEHYGLIFSTFKRLHTQVNYQGSGVGLGNCKKIVEFHEGDIFIESQLKKGSIFTIRIPKEITTD